MFISWFLLEVQQSVTLMIKKFAQFQYPKWILRLKGQKWETRLAHSSKMRDLQETDYIKQQNQKQIWKKKKRKRKPTLTKLNERKKKKI